MISFAQSKILGVEVNQGELRGSQPHGIPTPFEENPLYFDPEHIAQLHEFTGNSSSHLRTAMVLITGQLTVSHSYQLMVTERAGGGQLNRRLANIATGDPEMFEIIPDRRILRNDGQVFGGDLYRVLPENNVNLLAGAAAFVDTFSGMNRDSLQFWSYMTGQKTIDHQNTINALEILRFFGDSPDAEFQVTTGEGNAKESNPNF